VKNDAGARDFAELARKYSDDSGTRNGGGMLPATHASDLAPQLRRIVTSLESASHPRDRGTRVASPY